jgi:hypothetical protein
MVAGEAGEAVAGPNGDATGGETGEHGRSIRDLQQEEVGGRRPDPDAGQRGQRGGEPLADGGLAPDPFGGVLGSLVVATQGGCADRLLTAPKSESCCDLVTTPSRRSNSGNPRTSGGCRPSLIVLAITRHAAESASAMQHTD